MRVRYNDDVILGMRRDFTSFLKDAIEGFSLVSGGTAFQILGAISEKARLYVFFLENLCGFRRRLLALLEDLLPHESTSFWARYLGVL